KFAVNVEFVGFFRVYQKIRLGVMPVVAGSVYRAAFASGQAFDVGITVKGKQVDAAGLKLANVCFD
ncbi:hypothetical protein RSW31_24545, partial [Escherichia coli]